MIAWLRMKRWNWGLWVGLAIFAYLLKFPIDAELSPEARRMFAVAVFMGILWMTEAIPVSVTALLPLVLFPLLGIAKTSAISANYAHHLIFLFLGGFFIAAAMQKWALHKRFAVNTLYWVGKTPHQLVLAFMLATAFLSMWISNTATTIMILPIGLAVMKKMEGENATAGPFGAVLMLGIAYSASIGGMGTLIGTPPNLVFSAVYKKFFPQLPEIGFTDWLLAIFPLTVILFTITYFYLTRIFLRPEVLKRITMDRSVVETEKQALGSMSTPEQRVLVVFVLTALLWIFRSDIHVGQWVLPGWPHWIGLAGQIQDSTIAIGMAILLFILPAGVHEPEKVTLLHWKDILTIPWDILLLFGGGLALADGIQRTGLSEYFAQQLAFLVHLPPMAFILIITVSVAFLTEFTSNTAVATTILPVLAAVAQQFHIPPLMMMLPATIAASCAFMLPVATPPNAIVFSSRAIRIQQMVKIGVGLIIIASVVNGIYFTLLIRWFF